MGDWPNVSLVGGEAILDPFERATSPRTGSDQVSCSTVDSLITKASLNLYSPSGMADVPAGYLTLSVSSHADHGSRPAGVQGDRLGRDPLARGCVSSANGRGVQHGMHCGRSGAFRPDVDQP